MPIFPVELFEEILSNVPCSPQLFQLREVNRTFRDILSPRVFRTVTVLPTMASARRFCTLVGVPRFRGAARHVEEIVYTEPTQVDDVDPTCDEEGAEVMAVRTTLSLAFGHLHSLPALRSLNLQFYPTFDEDRWRWNRNHRESEHLRRQWAILKAVTGNLSLLPALDSLTLENFLAFPHELYTNPRIAPLVARLRHLHLKPLCHGGMDTAFYQSRLVEFWTDAAHVRLLRPATALTSLSLHCNTYPGGPRSAQLDFHSLEFPQLASLSLARIFFDYTDRSALRGGDVEDFIVRHAPHLARLELLACKMHVGFGSPARLWADVWARFGSTLTALADLAVKWDDDGDGCELRYGTYTIQNVDTAGAPILHKRVAGDERDADALAALAELVESRRAQRAVALLTIE
ncbi:hypothetical protein BC834DRAFT_846752 [Gloeopeniophorella convolvens]|nr:hypothetical protein BC834DRAFT_846752 [Gloeopeniophorella convolvens]